MQARLKREADKKSERGVAAGGGERCGGGEETLGVKTELCGGGEGHNFLSPSPPFPSPLSSHLLLVRLEKSGGGRKREEKWEIEG